MEIAVLSVAATVAAASLLLAWREIRPRRADREYYIAPITMFRRELSLTAISTIAAVVIWVAVTPSSVWAAAGAFLPLFFYFFLRTARQDGQ